MKFTQDQVFNIAVSITLSHEEGYFWDKDDPGGETKYGISQRAYPWLDIKNLTIEQARHIYLRDFWVKPSLNQLAIAAPDLAIKCFDLGVNCGPAMAIKFLQQAVNTVCAGEVPAMRQSDWRQKIARIINNKPLLVDGKIGPITLAVVSACPHHGALMAALKGEAYSHYKTGKAMYRAGWLNRLES